MNLNPFGVEIRNESNVGLEKVSHDSLASMIREHKLVLLRGFRTLAREEFLDYCRAIPRHRPLEWSFGPVMEMKESQDPQNYLFSREQVPFHWDGAFHRVPDYLVFCCVEAPLPGAGGETLFTNTEMIIDKAEAETKSLWSQVELKYETEKLAHYGGAIRGPLIQNHPRSGRSILRFAEPVKTKLNPVHLEVIGTSNENAATLVNDLTEKIYDPRFCYRHEWQVGDILFADNHALIHGRTGFQKNCPRHLRRIQLIEDRLL